MVQFLRVMSSNIEPLQTPITAMAAPGDAAQEKVLLFLRLTFKQALTKVLKVARCLKDLPLRLQTHKLTTRREIFKDLTDLLETQELGEKVRFFEIAI